MASAKKKATIDRRGLAKLIKDGYAKKDLALFFQISRPFLDRIIAGVDPAHVAVITFINERIAGLLKKAA